MTSRANPAYAAALTALWERSAYERGFITDPFGTAEAATRGLRRARALVDALGAPDRELAIVHVAGSKGKGSVATMIASMLTAAGHRTGLTTSPHLHSFRERIAIDDEPISEAAFAGVTRDAIAVAEAVEAAAPELGRVTTFELVIAMSLLAFARADCAAAVLEVGLGGEFDATNVVTPLVSVITTLDYEHTAVLGESMIEIAGAKAGIIKPCIPVVASAPVDEAETVLRSVAATNHAALLLGGLDWTWTGDWQDFTVSGPWDKLDHLRLALAGPHQVENAATAIAAITQLPPTLSVPAEAVRHGLASATIPGRFERVVLTAETLAPVSSTSKGPRTEPGLLILDGAHTPRAAGMLAATLAAEFPQQKLTIVLAMAADKNIAAIGRALAPVAARFVITRSSNPRAAEPEDIRPLLLALAIPISLAPDVATALVETAPHATRDRPVVVTGSLYAVADARVALGLATNDSTPDADSHRRAG